MYKPKSYKFGFDYRGLIMILSFLLPYIIFLILPEHDDVFKYKSLTPITDYIGLGFNVLMVLLLTFLINKNVTKKIKKVFLFVLLIPKVIYWICWILLYFHITHIIITIFLCVMPCIVFLLFSISRRNFYALLCAIIYTGCDIVFIVFNVILKV